MTKYYYVVVYKQTSFLLQSLVINYNGCHNPNYFNEFQHLWQPKMILNKDLFYMIYLNFTNSLDSGFESDTGTKQACLADARKVKVWLASQYAPTGRWHNYTILRL